MLCYLVLQYVTLPSTTVCCITWYYSMLCYLVLQYVVLPSVLYYLVLQHVMTSTVCDLTWYCSM